MTAERLTFKNFFTKPYLLDPTSQDLDTKDHNKALFCSIILGIFTIGLVHLGYATDRAIKNWCFKPSDGKENQTEHKTKDIATARGVVSEEKLKDQPPPNLTNTGSSNNSFSKAKKPDSPPKTSHTNPPPSKKSFQEELQDISHKIGTTENLGTLTTKMRLLLTKIISQGDKNTNHFLKDFPPEHLCNCEGTSVKVQFDGTKLDNIKNWTETPTLSEKQVSDDLQHFSSYELAVLCQSINNKKYSIPPKPLTPEENTNELQKRLENICHRFETEKYNATASLDLDLKLILSDIICHPSEGVQQFLVDLSQKETLTLFLDKATIVNFNPQALKCIKQWIKSPRESSLVYTDHLPKNFTPNELMSLCQGIKNGNYLYNKPLTPEEEKKRLQELQDVCYTLETANYDTAMFSQMRMLLTRIICRSHEDVKQFLLDLFQIESLPERYLKNDALKIKEVKFDEHLPTIKSWGESRPSEADVYNAFAKFSHEQLRALCQGIKAENLEEEKQQLERELKEISTMRLKEHDTNILFPKMYSVLLKILSWHRNESVKETLTHLSFLKEFELRYFQNGSEQKLKIQFQPENIDAIKKWSETGEELLINEVNSSLLSKFTGYQIAVLCLGIESNNCLRTPTLEEEKKELKEQLDHFEEDLRTKKCTSLQDQKIRAALAKIISRHRNDSVKKCLSDLVSEKEPHTFTFMKDTGEESTISRNLNGWTQGCLSGWGQSTKAPSERVVLKGLQMVPSADLFIICLRIRKAKALELVKI